MKKVIIIGSGPAGISAALYLKRSGKADVLVISSGIGALEKAESIENYYGFAGPVSGRELYENGVAGAKRIEVEFVTDEVVSLTFDMEMRPVVGTKTNEYTADALLLATGASRKAPAVPGLKEHEGKGVSYCAVCDAFFYRQKDVCVIGSGEYAVHEAEVLAAPCGSVTILTNGQPMKAGMPEGIGCIEKPISSINGEGVVDSVTFDDGTEINTSGVFVAVGVAGSGDLARKVGAETENGRIKFNDKMETSIPGLFAAGDCIGGRLQVYKAVSDGAAAALSILEFLKK